MASKTALTVTQIAIKAASAGLGAAAGGPLGAALGGMLGQALSGAAAEMVAKCAEEFGKKAGEKVFELSGESIADSLKDSPANLTAAYRKALLLSLNEVRSDAGGEWNDWFLNWERCLRSDVALDLDRVNGSTLVPEKLDELFCSTMERLDEQGARMRRKSLTLKLPTRTMPEGLRLSLMDRLPTALETNYRALIVKSEYEEGWKQLE